MPIRYFFLRLMTVLVTGIFPSFAGAQPTIQKISAHIFTRQAEDGFKSMIQGNLYYKANGNLVSHFTTPKDYIMITNRQGEVRIYNEDNNTVIQFQNQLFSSNILPFFYFFTGKTGDMGLRQAGFRVVKTGFEDKLVVTLWKAVKKNPKNPVVYVKLVHNGATPIYMDYEDSQHKVLRKVFYYNYTHVNGINYPKALTEILYKGKDSVVTKTEYSDFKVNNRAESPYFNFKIPSNAKLVKK